MTIAIGTLRARSAAMRARALPRCARAPAASAV